MNQFIKLCYNIGLQDDDDEFEHFKDDSEFEGFTETSSSSAPSGDGKTDGKSDEGLKISSVS